MNYTHQHSHKTDIHIKSEENKYKYYHCISGTSYILHKNIINKFVNIYKNYLDKLVDKNNIWTDQVILTHIYKDNKELFCQLGNDYGMIIKLLY